MSEMNRLRWRCRRGMKELDRAMLAYLEQHYATAPAAEQQVFLDLLDWQDPDLYLLITQKRPPDTAEIAHVVERIHRALDAQH